MKTSYSFTNPQIQKIMSEFHDCKIYYKRHTVSKEATVKSLPSDLLPIDITWNWGVSHFHKLKENDSKYAFCRLFRLFITHECVNEQRYQNILSRLNETTRFSHVLFELFNDRLSPFNLIISGSDSCADFIQTDADDEFLYEKLEHFINSNKMLSRANRSFFRNFKASLSNLNITKLTDFNFNTFKVQYGFFKKSVNRNNGLLSLLKNFYISLHLDGIDIFKNANIDINYFSSSNFLTWFNNGFKLINCNPYDDVPEEDKWVLVPGELTSYSTKLRKSKYITVDFSDIPNTKMLLAAKEWYWRSSINLISRNEALYIIKNFLSFILKQRKKTNSVPISFISPEEIFLYSRYISLKNQSPKLNTISRFLKYINDVGLCEIDESCHLYLKARQPAKIEQATDIPDEHILRLEEILKNNSDISPKNHLLYLIFHIALATELRISSIIHLRVDCLSYGSGNSVYLNTNTKISGDKIIQIVIPKRIQRLIESAIFLTKPYREFCLHKDDQDLLFIYPTNNRAKPFIVRTFTDNLKQISLSADLPPYTAANLRDTYMSKVVTMAINTGKSILEIKSLTLHQVLSTTSKHYVSTRIREFLENVHMVKIGDVDLNGQITIIQDEYSQNLVNNSCGYCNENMCDKINKLPCLWCNGFVTTISRIPYFEAEIRAIDKEIMQSALVHDKDHLVLIKRLYMAYLEQLYVLKEEHVYGNIANI